MDNNSSAQEFSFGAFRLFPDRQLLLEGDAPVKIGARTLELLSALVERPGELVGKDELMARIWPDTSVGESNLKVQIATLRRALGDGHQGQRYVATANGRGYRFVAPVARSGVRHASAVGVHNLAGGWTRPLGRDEVIETLKSQLAINKLMTVVGPGGIGKTTVALALANSLLQEYADGVWVVELAALQAPHLVAEAIRAALGPQVRSEGEAQALPLLLRDRRMLIVLDCCEHLVEAAAAIAEDIVRQAPNVHVLATSREPLRANGEAVYRLGSLAVPPEGALLPAAETIRYPAVQLFVERAASAQRGFRLTDQNAKFVAEICRRLDGIALAIELAARRTDAFTPSKLLALLSDRFSLLNCGRRTDLPRHQTLAAAIDWSFDLLPESERAILCRLSIFQGAFALESAIAVATGEDEADAAIVAGIGNLVSKSLVAAEMSGLGLQYRLLDSMRAYARQKLVESGGLSDVARRHAHHHWALFLRAESEWQNRPPADWFAEFGRCIDDARSALDWAFSAEGDAELGASLAAVSVPLWIHLSLVDECRRQMERALDASWDRGADNGRIEMKLSAALGTALLQTRGPQPRAKEAWRLAAERAERIGDRSYQLQALWGLCDYHTWRGEHRVALGLSERIRTIAIDANDRIAEVNVGRQAGTALRYLGQLSDARAELERMIGAYVEPVHWTHASRFQLDPRIAARGTLANVLWLQGYSAQAIALSRRALADAKAANHALAICNAYAHTAIPIALYSCDWQRAECWLGEVLDHTTKHAMPIWNAIGRCLKGIAQFQRGEPMGLTLLSHAVEELGGTGFRMRHPAYLGSLASGLGATGRHAEANQVIDRALASSEQLQELWCMGELLRIKGELLRTDRSSSDAAQTYFQQSIELSRRQGALLWEWRATASLAQLWRDEDRSDQADELLVTARARLTDAFDDGKPRPVHSTRSAAVVC